jgi:hypothetical protein
VPLDVPVHMYKSKSRHPPGSLRRAAGVPSKMEAEELHSRISHSSAGIEFVV